MEWMRPNDEWMDFVRGDGWKLSELIHGEMRMDRMDEVTSIQYSTISFAA